MKWGKICTLLEEMGVVYDDDVSIIDFSEEGNGEFRIVWEKDEKGEYCCIYFE